MAAQTYASVADDAEWTAEHGFKCEHCGVPVVLNYDGRGTGWSHLYDYGTPHYLASGTKACK